MIKRFEKKYIPKVRKKKWYKRLKVVVLAPTVLPIYAILMGLKWLAQKLKVRISRKKRPDLVLENIIAGWTNLILPNQVSEDLAMYRAKICAECPLAVFSTSVHTIVIDNKTKNIRGLSCSECGCPLSAKVRSDGDYCPVGKW